jgi:hypothetical protein
MLHSQLQKHIIEEEEKMSYELKMDCPSCTKKGAEILVGNLPLTTFLES